MLQGGGPVSGRGAKRVERLPGDQAVRIRPTILPVQRRATLHPFRIEGRAQGTAPPQEVLRGDRQGKPPILPPCSVFNRYLFYHRSSP